MNGTSVKICISGVQTTCYVYFKCVETYAKLIYTSTEISDLNSLLQYHKS
jgi:hypothetical protein